jgi:hypothetical protein
MIYKVNFLDTSKFLNLPETGMGYQIFDSVIYGSTIKKRYLVYNADLILDFDKSFAESKKQVFSRNYNSLLSEVKTLKIDFNDIKILNKSQLTDTVQNLSLKFNMMNEVSKKNKHRYYGGKAANDSAKEYANGDEEFVRLSAFEEDKRIDNVRKRLKEFSYATTRKDYLDCINYFDDPVDRYALPNDDKIKWCFYIKPKIKDNLQRGIVQPAFGHEGGGIEGYFENGTSNETFLYKKEYGK